MRERIITGTRAIALTGSRAMDPSIDGYIGPLDDITSEGAYCISHLRTAYTGPLIRLRRDSDDAESDFSVDSQTNVVDVVAIAAFLSAADGFVKTRYDQSGNGRDLVQTLADNQPQFVLGALGSNPAIKFVAANSTTLSFDSLSAWNFVHQGDGASIWALLKEELESPSQQLYMATGVSSAHVGFFLAIKDDLGATDQVRIIIQRGVGGQLALKEELDNALPTQEWLSQLITLIDQGGDDCEVFLNNVSQGTQEKINAYASGDAEQNLVIGGTVSYYEGLMATVVLMPSVLTPDERVTLNAHAIALGV